MEGLGQFSGRKSERGPARSPLRIFSPLIIDYLTAAAAREGKYSGHIKDTEESAQGSDGS